MFARRFSTIAATCTAATVLVACMANPGPPPLGGTDPVERTPTASESQTAAPNDGAVPTASTTSEEKPEPTDRSTALVGVDELRNGLNPHLVANRSELVDNIASLVLPSTFVDGELNTDVFVSAEERAVPTDKQRSAQGASESPSATPTARSTPKKTYVQRVRYEIAPEAQWSDGKPITAEDFTYLWTQLTTTPGVINSAPYHSIGDIDSSAGGRVVDVYFTREVADWQQMFHNLLPAHLLSATPDSFTSDLGNGIPASAGRYRVASVDRARGIIELNRNDRFWGSDPALIDVLKLMTVRSTTQGVDYLRTGQMQFVDIAPYETTADAFGLVPGVDTSVAPTGRQLELQLNVDSNMLGDTARRKALLSVIDRETLARITAGRSVHVQSPDAFGDKARAEIEAAAAHRDALAAATATDPLRLAADPADPQASAAVRTIVDMLASEGIKAEVVSASMSDIAEELSNGSTIDGVMSWGTAAPTPASAAGRYLCPDGSKTPLADNFTRYCPRNAADNLDDILSGDIASDSLERKLRALNNATFTRLLILTETRLRASGTGLVAPARDLSEAHTWQLEQ